MVAIPLEGLHVPSQPGFVAEQRRHPCRRHGLGRVEAVGVPAQGLEPREHRGGSAGIDEGQPVGLDQLGSLVAETRGAQVRDRLVDVTVRPVPLGSALVQLRHPVGVPGLQLAAGHGGEQVVEPEPSPVTVEPDQEQVLALQVVEDLCRVRRVGQTRRTAAR